MIAATVFANELGPFVGGDGRVAQTKTESDGSYVLSQLLQGPYWLGAKHPSLPGGSLDDHPKIQLEEGASYALDLGNVIFGRWKVRLIDTRGEAIGGPRLVSLRERTTQLERTFVSDVDGRFDAPLPPGEYDVLVGFQNQLMIEAESVSMGPEELVRDLTCTTSAVAFQPSCFDCNMSDRQVAIELAKEVRLVPVREDGGASYRPEIPRASGMLFFYGVSDGEYRLEPGDNFGIDVGGEEFWFDASKASSPRPLRVYRR